jgi:hypothetical protein
MFLSETERNSHLSAMASCGGTPRSRRPGARGDVFCTEPVRSHPPRHSRGDLPKGNTAG